MLPVSCKVLVLTYALLATNKAYIQLCFIFQIQGTSQHSGPFLAYVQCFDVVSQLNGVGHAAGQVPDPVSGPFALKWATWSRDEQLRDIIPLMQIQAGAQMVPHFGQKADPWLPSYNCIKYGSKFWLNRYKSFVLYTCNYHYNRMSSYQEMSLGCSLGKWSSRQIKYHFSTPYYFWFWCFLCCSGPPCLAMLKFSPEPGFKLWTTDLNLRFRSGLVPVLLADHMFSSWFQKANNFANPVWTSNHRWFNKHIYYFIYTCVQRLAAQHHHLWTFAGMLHSWTWLLCDVWPHPTVVSPWLGLKAVSWWSWAKIQSSRADIRLDDFMPPESRLSQ